MFKLIFIVIFAVLVVWLGPLASIWAVNTLFGTAIPYVFETWAASLFLGAVVSGRTHLSFKTKV